jgi:uncharacterized protein YdeI (YjbR/CyaY-like superfamily)
MSGKSLGERAYLEFQSPKEWRTWLAEHFQRPTSIWVRVLKKRTPHPGLHYEEAVEEAICFGWIDGQVNQGDDTGFLIKFAPRRKKSIWSEINKKKAERLIREGRMTEAGMARIEEAKQNGRWDAAYRLKKDVQIPEDLQAALQEDATARRNFQTLANSYKFQYVYWINEAKRAPTRQKRIQHAVEKLRANKRAYEN